jgi:hypothetical protein
MVKEWAAVLAVMLLPIGASGQTVVVDGDTLKLGGQRIRLHGIDAPELTPGPLARDRLVAVHRWAAGGCQPIDRDRYGRTVARCYAGREDLGARMVSAWAFTRYRLDYAGLELAGRGRWAGRTRSRLRAGRRLQGASQGRAAAIDGRAAGWRRPTSKLLKHANVALTIEKLRWPSCRRLSASCATMRA